ncbi:MAG: hypothetical protein ACI9N9_000092 [Enterobacterales bacterium]|jgi:hypothetical protein
MKYILIFLILTSCNLAERQARVTAKLKAKCPECIVDKSDTTFIVETKLDTTFIDGVPVITEIHDTISKTITVIEQTDCSQYKTGWQTWQEERTKRKQIQTDFKKYRADTQLAKKKERNRSNEAIKTLRNDLRTTRKELAIQKKLAGKSTNYNLLFGIIGVLLFLAGLIVYKWMKSRKVNK